MRGSRRQADKTTWHQVTKGLRPAGELGLHSRQWETSSVSHRGSPSMGHIRPWELLHYAMFTIWVLTVRMLGVCPIPYGDSCSLPTSRHLGVGVEGMAVRAPYH